MSACIVDVQVSNSGRKKTVERTSHFGEAQANAQHHLHLLISYWQLASFEPVAYESILWSM